MGWTEEVTTSSWGLEGEIYESEVSVIIPIIPFC